MALICISLMTNEYWASFHWFTCHLYIFFGEGSLCPFFISFCCLFKNFYLLIFRERGRGRERETSICSSTYLCIHWLILVCALTWDWTCNLGILGRCSNQLRYAARVGFFVFLLLNFKSSLYILGTSYMSDMWFVNIFS